MMKTRTWLFGTILAAIVSSAAAPEGSAYGAVVWRRMLEKHIKK
jgi:hypothetical protein